GRDAARVAESALRAHTRTPRLRPRPAPGYLRALAETWLAALFLRRRRRRGGPAGAKPHGAVSWPANRRYLFATVSSAHARGRRSHGRADQRGPARPRVGGPQHPEAGTLDARACGTAPRAGAAGRGRGVRFSCGPEAA